MQIPFRNLTLFRLPESHRWSDEFFGDDLARMRAREPGPLELSCVGFTSPFGPEDERLFLECSPYYLLAVQRQERNLPASVVQRELEKRIRSIADTQGRKPGGKERKRVKEEVITELLPRAFVKVRTTLVYVDLDAGWIVVDTSSRKIAEDVVSMLREANGRCPATAMTPEESPRALMTSWLIEGTCPNDLAAGDECELRDPASAGAVWRGRRQDLDSDEVREHLRAGKQVFQVGLEFDGRMGFVLADDLTVRKLRFFDVVLDQLKEATEETDADVERKTSFMLMTAELQRLLSKIESIFGLARPRERV